MIWEWTNENNKQIAHATVIVLSYRSNKKVQMFCDPSWHEALVKIVIHPEALPILDGFSVIDFLNTERGNATKWDIQTCLEGGATTFRKDHRISCCYLDNQTLL